MKNETSHEWVLEEIDDTTKDIVDVNHADTLEELLQFISPEKRYDITLTRVIHNRVDGVLELYHAYVEHGVLPKHFEGTRYVVPVQYHRQLKKAIDTFKL